MANPSSSNPSSSNPSANTNSNNQVPLGRTIKAGNRITAQNLSLLAKRLQRCGDVDPLTGYVCVTQCHDPDVQHMAVQIGGVRDGFVYHTWGGSLPNNLYVPAQAVPSE